MEKTTLDYVAYGNKGQLWQKKHEHLKLNRVKWHMGIGAYPLDLGAISALEVCNTQESEGDGEEGEQSDKGDVSPQSAEPHHEGDDGETEEENPDSTAHVALVTDVSLTNVEPRDENGGVWEPEGAVGAEHGGSERVPESESPHSAQKLGETAIEERHPDHHVRWGGHRHPEDACVHAREHERCGSEGEESEGDRVRCYWCGNVHRVGLDSIVIRHSWSSTAHNNRSKHCLRKLATNCKN